MDTTRIEDEISAIASIYEDSFIRDKPKAWQQANPLPAFSITVLPESPDLQEHVSVRLHVTFPRTYPKAPATFAISETRGLTTIQSQALTKALREEALRCAGEEMVMTVAMFCASWITSTNNAPKGKNPSKNISLAAEMKERAREREEDLRRRAEEEAQRIRDTQEQHANQLAQRIEQDVQQKREHMMRRESERRHEEALAIAEKADPVELVTQTFESGVHIGDAHFKSVRLSFPRRDGLATVYYAEPISEEQIAAPLLELYRIEFDADHYTKGQGQKKVRSLHDELRRLIGLQHENLLCVYATQLLFAKGRRPIPTIMILAERAPPLTLAELLSTCESLPPTKVIAFMTQIATGVEYLHAQKLMHRALSISSINISTRTSGSSSSTLLKIRRCCFHGVLLDLYKSNSFGTSKPTGDMSNSIPDSWLPREVLESRYQYTARRDVWFLGIMMLQMLSGINVINDWESPVEALTALDIPTNVANLLSSILDDSRKRMTTATEIRLKLSLLANESSLHVPQLSLRTSNESRTITSPRHARAHGKSFSSRYASWAGQSRYRQDWEELEFLGKGGFGSVVKARLKHDNRIYAIKKVKLRGENDGKLLREVNALSRMSHSAIVRYYTTWIESVPKIQSKKGPSSLSSSASETESGSQESSEEEEDDSSDFGDPFHVSSASLPDISFARSSTFPSLQGSADPSRSGVSFDDDDEESINSSDTQAASGLVGRQEKESASRTQILYIQMEYVEKQTLKEAIEEGLSEERAWVLFRQILDALEHIASWGIVHRDIKLGNIFIDAKGDVKVGDFGLASFRSSAIDVGSSHDDLTAGSSELTTGVGTGLYIAPEVLHRKPGQTYSKADMYSLGIVFFEMNMPPFTTNTERLHVITALRSPGICFPPEWNPKERTNQRQVITLLLQHDPDKRPTAGELQRNDLLPKRMEEESINEALRLLVNPQSRRYDALLRTLFTQPVDPAAVFSYDATSASKEYAPYLPMIRDSVVGIFRMHGAIEDEPPLLMPLMEEGRKSQEGEKNPAPVFLDRQGGVVCLPKNVIVPLARSAALSGLERIKRYYCGHAYQDAPGQPTAWLQGAFDIISPDVASQASEAEALLVMDEILKVFPRVDHQTYDVHISHTGLVASIFERIPEDRHQQIITVLENSKSSASQKRVLLANQGLSRTLIDEMELLVEPVTIDEAMERLRPRLDRKAVKCLDDIQLTVKLVTEMGVRRRILVKPFLMQGHALFRSGIVFEFFTGKRAVVGRGGRYDHLIARFTPPATNARRVPIKAIGLQVVLEQLAQSLSVYQKSTLGSLIKEKRSFGPWSPRRCDVYVVSFAPTQRETFGGMLEQRMRVVAKLWQNGISADFMYDSDIDRGLEGHIGTCLREGILFVVWETRHGTFKVKSVLRGTETEERAHDLVAFLQRELERNEQATTSGSRPQVHQAQEGAVASTKDVSSVQVLLAGDKDAQRKKHKAKVTYAERAFAMDVELRRDVASGLCVIAADVPGGVFGALTACSSAWMTSEEIWRAFVGEHPSLAAVAGSLRETVVKRRQEQDKYVLLYSVRDDKPFLLKVL